MPIKCFTKTNVLLLSLVLVGAGCGGSGGGGSTPTVANPFRGTWSGNWTSVPADTGTASLTIASDGSFTGQLHNNNQDTDGTDSGTITNAGQLTVTVTFSGEGSYTLSGQFSQNGQGQMTGDVTGTVNGNVISYSFTFTKQ